MEHLQGVQSTGVYEYEPLATANSFRLLQLSSASTADHIQCSLKNYSLDGKFYRHVPIYTTVSYAWGPTFNDGSHLSKTITCDGKIMKVTKTVHDFLQRIAKLEARGNTKLLPIRLWIDGICIDQANILERNHQVKCMTSIYSKCEGMIVWLGETGLNVRDCFADLASASDSVRRRIRAETGSWPTGESLHHLYGHPIRVPPPSFDQESRTWEGHMIEYLRDLPDDHLYMLVLLLSPSHLPAPLRLFQSLGDRNAAVHGFVRRGLRELTHLAWFHRKWVVQEVALTVSQNSVVMIADIVYSFDELVAQFREHDVLNSASSLGIDTADSSLRQRLIEFQDTQCSDPHDHIFALLGVSKDQPDVAVDYNQNIEALYTDVAKLCLAEGDIVSFMATATAKKPGLELPSWVPDWRARWTCDRSIMHADAMDNVRRHMWKGRGYPVPVPTKSLGRFSSKFRLAKIEQLPRHNGPAAKLKRDDHVKLQDDHVRVHGWVVQRRCDSGQGSCHSCATCRLLQPDLVQSDYALDGVLPQHFSVPGTAHVQQRQACVRNKWLPLIREQLDVVLNDNEVLCFIQDSPIAFVLSISGRAESVEGSRSYRLEFCIQVDEVQWMSHWFAESLGVENRELVFIV